MKLNLSKELKHTFDLVALRNKTKGLRTPNDWDKGNNITKRYRRETNKQTQAYYAEYDTRVSNVVKKLIDKAGAKQRDFKHRFFGADNFDKDVLIRKAHKVVQHDHHRRIAQLEKNEAQELGELIEQIEQRDRLLEKPGRDFERASDRRKNQQAPQTQTRRHSRHQ